MGKILTKAAALVVGLAVAASTIVSTELPAAAATADCQATFKKYSTVRAGSTGSKAKAMECLLANAGFSTTVNGSFSAADATALAAFRKSIGLKPLKSGGRRAWSARSIRCSAARRDSPPICATRAAGNSSRPGGWCARRWRGTTWC